MAAKKPSPPPKLRRMTPQEPMTLVGVDPGKAGQLAVAMVEWSGGRLVRATVWTVKDGPPWTWHRMANLLIGLVLNWRTDAVCVEDQKTVITGKGARGQTTHAGLEVLFAQGLCYAAGVPVVTLQQNSIKAAVANGRATKEQVSAAVRAILAANNVGCSPKGEHEHDAIATAIAGRARILSPTRGGLYMVDGTAYFFGAAEAG